MPARPVDPHFGHRMRALLEERGMSYRTLAALTFHAKSYLHEIATGRKQPTPEVARRADDALGAGGRLAELVPQGPARQVSSDDNAAELARRITASDVGTETLERLELAVDDLAVGYVTRPAADLVPLLG
jgi:transcriptional regulator with XRE-family HTH domain